MKKNTDDLGDRMKMYELHEAGRKLIPCLPIMARLDGRSFHRFCKGLNRPYDERLSRLMIDCVKYLMSETNALCGYTQSDEITLTWYYNNTKSQPLFNGKVSKLTSTLAAMQTAFFNCNVEKYIPGHPNNKTYPTFDCRVWNVPNISEGANCFLWREQDATKNSISMAARKYFSHKELHGKSGPEMQEILFSKYNTNWNNYPSFFKRGTFIKKYIVEKINKDSNIIFYRSEYHEVDLPAFSKIMNRADFIYNNAEPIEFLE